MGPVHIIHAQPFAQHRLAHAVSNAIGISLAVPVSAQDAVTEEPMIEEVVVKGIRSSLKRAMDTKRDSQGVVDAITAEDIGDFPDTNLAEALQRITGVAIDRERGEGATVTVRGFGADLNLVTLNERRMPTHPTHWSNQNKVCGREPSDSRSHYEAETDTPNI